MDDALAFRLENKSNSPLANFLWPYDKPHYTLLINVYWNKYGLIQTDATNEIVVYSFFAWLITESITMHSVHLPFQCSKVYRLHINYHMSMIWPPKKKIRIILLILDFKLGTVDNQKDYLQTWENSTFSFFIIIFLYKNRNTGFSSRYLLRLQKFCTNSRYRTGSFCIQ